MIRIGSNSNEKKLVRRHGEHLGSANPEQAMYTLDSYGYTLESSPEDGTGGWLGKYGI